MACFGFMQQHRSNLLMAPNTQRIAPIPAVMHRYGIAKWKEPLVMTARLTAAFYNWLSGPPTSERDRVNSIIYHWKRVWPLLGPWPLGGC
jgi:hypothetical protein